jgi:hypothetical protein
MAYELKNRLVVGVASSALFDLTESDALFRSEGEESYRQYQKDHLKSRTEHAASVHVPYGIANGDTKLLEMASTAAEGGADRELFVIADTGVL